MKQIDKYTSPRLHSEHSCYFYLFVHTSLKYLSTYFYARNKNIQVEDKHQYRENLKIY